MTRRVLLAVFLATFVYCCVSAAGTATQMWRVGLAATPPPSTFGVVFRLASLVLALALWPLARRVMEHVTIVTFLLGAGASVLIGLGLRSGALDAVRVVYHLFMFSFGAIAMLGLAADTHTERFVSREVRHTDRVAVDHDGH